MEKKETQGISSDEFSFSAFFTPLTNKKVILFLSIIGLFVFFNALFNGFVYDDDMQIVNNPLVHSISSLPYFFAGGNFFDPGTGQIVSIFYRPIPSTVFTFLYPLSGGQPFVFHLIQLLIHITNASLIFLFFSKFFKRTLAFFLATIFLIHPINQETVAYISDMQDVLFFFFGMMALLITASTNMHLRKIVLVNILLFIGLLSKETAILFVPILLLYTFLEKRKEFAKAYILPLLVTTAVYLYLRFSIAHVSPITDALVPIMQASFVERLLTMPEIILYYLQTFFFPLQLALGHAWVIKQPTLNSFYLPLLLDSLFFVLLFFFGKSLFKLNKKQFLAFIFFALWFILGLMLHLQFIPLDATVADRWFYFPFVGLLGIIGLFCTLPIFKKISREVLLIGAIVVIVILSLRTMVRNTNWNTMLTLCQHDLQVVPESYNVQSVCGGELFKAGRFEESKQYFAVASQLAPKWGTNWYQYGLSYEYTKDVTSARKYYRKSITLSNEVNAYVSLAATYLKYDKDPKVAKEIVEEGLKHYPNYQRLQLYLAVCDYQLGDKQKAFELATRIHQSAPSPESAYVLNQIMQNQKIVLQ